MHKSTRRPELRPFPDSHPCLYYLFPSPLTATLITQAVARPSLVSGIPISRITTPVITGTCDHRTAPGDRRVRKRRGRRTHVRRCPAHRRPYGHRPLAHKGLTSSIAGGVRIGPNAEEERELTDMAIVKHEEMKRVEERTLGGPVPRFENSQYLTPGTPIVPYTHISSTTNHNQLPSSPAYPH